MRIDHFAFEVSNMEASIRFYVDKLGFKLQGTFNDDNQHEIFSFLEMDGGRLELLQILDEHNKPKPFTPIVLRPHYCPHLAIQTDDIDKTISFLSSQKIDIVHGPLEAPGVAKWLYICDPDDNVVEFIQELSR